MQALDSTLAIERLFTPDLAATRGDTFCFIIATSHF